MGVVGTDLTACGDLVEQFRQNGCVTDIFAVDIENPDLQRCSVNAELDTPLEFTMLAQYPTHLSARP